MTNGKKKAAKSKASREIAATESSAKKAAKKAKKTAAATQQLSTEDARALIQETRQELRRLKDEMMDPVFIAKVRGEHDPELENELGSTLFDLIDLHELLSNALLDSILQELTENEEALRQGISGVRDARRDLSKIKKIFEAADKLLAVVSSVVKRVI